LEGVGIVADGIGAQVTLGDESVINTLDLKAGEAIRRRFSGRFGNGTDYGAIFAGVQGLEIGHYLHVHKQYPFVFIEISVKNVSEQPIAVARLTPMVIPQNGLKNWTGDVRMVRHDVMHEAHHGYAETASLDLVLLCDAANKNGISFGVIPSGRGTQSIALEASAVGWHGTISNTFSPAVELAPGETLVSDPVWFSYRVATPAQLDSYYDWMHTELLKPFNPPVAAAPEAAPDADAAPAADAPPEGTDATPEKEIRR
ncbi:MAG: hypothetical protein K8F31_07085, partial [Roseovarius sp.]|nr:hypothetical protein [Roseovarius sp.]